MIFNEDDPFPKIVITHKQIDGVIESTGVNLIEPSRVSDLYQWLEDRIGAYLTSRYWANQATPSVLVKRFDNIASLSRRLISQLKEEPGIRLEIRAFLNRGLFDRGLKDRAPFGIEALIANLRDLAIGAEGAAAVAKAKVQKNRARHDGDPALDDFFKDLAGLWIEFFGCLPTMSFNPIKDEISGPFFVFLSGILKAMNQAVATEMIAYDPKLRRAFDITPAAIYARFQRTGIPAGISKLKKAN